MVREAPENAEKETHNTKLQLEQTEPSQPPAPQHCSYTTRVMQCLWSPASIPPHPLHPPIPTQNIQYFCAACLDPIRPAHHITDIHPGQPMNIMQVEHNTHQPRRSHGGTRILVCKRGCRAYINHVVCMRWKSYGR